MRSLLAGLVCTFVLSAGWLQGEETPALSADHQKKMALGLDLFKREVRTILVGRCVKCHGGEETEGEFDLTSREALLRGGAEGKAITLGDSKKSRMMQYIRGELEPQMPDDGSPLSPQAQAALAKWIDLGAPYDKPLIERSDDPLAWTTRKIEPAARAFWSFQPLANTTPPSMENDSWSHSDIDRFLLRELREQGLTPNEPADRRRLIRRAHLDLTGLPPTPEEIESFLKDTDPQAYAKLIDRLLESPHYGAMGAALAGCGSLCGESRV